MKRDNHTRASVDSLSFNVGHAGNRITFGHSLIVSPWGEILAEADDHAPQVIVADIDPALVIEARTRVPSLAHDRPFSVRAPRSAEQQQQQQQQQQVQPQRAAGTSRTSENVSIPRRSACFTANPCSFSPLLPRRIRSTL